MTETKVLAYIYPTFSMDDNCGSANFSIQSNQICKPLLIAQLQPRILGLSAEKRLAVVTKAS